MNKTVSSLLLGGVLAFNLAACATDATNAVLPRPAEEAASCGETVLTEAKAAKMGQPDCSRAATPAPAVGK